jgi:fructose-bisphosphate aldolase class 1
MNSPGLKEQQLRKIKTQPGFIAALDQSGGSTPKALLNYGIKPDAWSNEEEMFALVHQMRARIITSPSSTGAQQDDFYLDCVRHPKVLKVVALSGGYSRAEGNDPLRSNHGVVVSFSRALVEGLTVQQSNAEYNASLDAAIQSIFEASNK